MKIKNLEQANEALREMAELQRTLAGAEAALNGKIDSLKKASIEKAAPLQAKLTELEKAIQVYAEYNQGELFLDRKSVALSFGSFGFRSSTALKTMSKWTWEKVLSALKSLGGKGAVRGRKR
ncbi:MAG: host-nuclease inhibitor Gam family protein [Nitrospinae bacterium]|nr:host-nuclease inhibitor Gam family protein [Nitrospinota bacterium]